LSEFFEIAYAAASNRLCLFTGTGFSKAVTGNVAPSWQALLESVCDLTTETAVLKGALFPSDGNKPLSLEEAAQVIEIELLKSDKKIHAEIAKKISTLKLKGNNSAISDFLSKRILKVVTTNYDKLVEELITDKQYHTLTPGLPVPRSQARVKVYHVHGSIDSPENMVVTSDDYFKFINNESYFSRKLSVVLHENTVVILGYSLGDTNLKAIISDYKGFSRNHVIGSNLFLVSKSKVDQHVKDYYSHCYGIRVLDQKTVHEFFDELNTAMPEAEKIVTSSVSNIKKVLFEKHNFNDKYLSVENSFFEIISSLAAIGQSINEPNVVLALGKIIQTKIELTKPHGAWTQYEHLARWLIYLASILELKNTTIEGIYLDAALHSMNSMRKEYRIGYSWHAFTSWNSRWDGIIASNRAIIRTHIETNTEWPDALAVVRRG
jgi:SIR2-like domain